MVQRAQIAGLALAFACRNKGPADTFPVAGTPEAVAVTWEGGAQPGLVPSVVDVDGTWHLYFTSLEGSIHGTLHATSDDGSSFTLTSGHRVLDDVVASSDDAAVSAVAYVAGSTIHLLSNVKRSGVSEVWHATSVDGDTFTAGAAPTFAAAAAPADGDPQTLTVTGAIYAPIDGIAWMRVDRSGDSGDPAVSTTTSSDGGDSWSDPSEVLSAGDIPEPWTGATVGAGGLWGATVAVAPDGGYHMLYLGAAPNGDSPLGVGHAFSADDGASWDASGDLWFAPDDGGVLNGLCLVADDAGYWLYYGETPAGGVGLTDGALYRMRIE